MQVTDESLNSILVPREFRGAIYVHTECVFLTVRYRNLVRLARGNVLCGDMQHSIGIEFEGDFDLGKSSRPRSDSGQNELAQTIVVLRQGALTFEDLDLHGGLVVLVSGEHLFLLARDGAVALDDLGHHLSCSLDSQRKRGHIHQQHVLRLLVRHSGEDGCLDRGSIGDGFIGVDGSVGLLAIEEIADELLHLRDAGRPSHQHHFVDLILGHFGILQHLFHGEHARFEVIAAQILEARTGESGVEINAFEKGIDLQRRLRAAGQSTFGPERE
jgi:hypothetical protein